MGNKPGEVPGRHIEYSGTAESCGSWPSEGITSVTPVCLHRQQAGSHNRLGASNRQKQAKGIAPFAAVHKHIPAMHLRDGFDDRQPQPVIGPAVAARGIHSIEALEQAW